VAWHLQQLNATGSEVWDIIHEPPNSLVSETENNQQRRQR
jgi:hypothetical protein